MSVRQHLAERGQHDVGTELRDELLAGIPVAERRLNLQGVSTPVLEGGAGAPVVLLHGPGGNATHWFQVIPALATTHRVIAPDLPGQGSSAVEGEPLDAGRVLDWLGELIEQTCAAPPALVGYALGGAIAARFAVDRSDRLSRLVLVDALGLSQLQPAPEFGLALSRFLSEPSEQTHDDLWRRCAFDLDALRARMAHRWELFRAYNLDRIRASGVMSALGALMEQFGEPAIPAADLERIGVPTSLIWGRHDLAAPLGVAMAVGDRHGWPVQVVDQAADDPPVEQPDAFLAALRVALGSRTGPEAAS